jgi:hypothetical protein
LRNHGGGRLTAAAGLVLVLLAGCGHSGDQAATGAWQTPPAPTVRTDLVWFATEPVTLPGAVRPPKTAALGGPTFSFQLAELATVTELGADVISSLDRVPNYTGVPSGATAPVPATAGSEFVLARFAEVEGRPLNTVLPGFPGSGTSAALRVGTETRKVPHSPSEGVLIAQVPTGAPVTLVVEDAGREQSIDLRTGVPGPNAITEYARRLPQAAQRLTLAGLFAGRPPGTEVKVKLSATVHLYASGRWAKPGRAFLLVGVEVEMFDFRGVGGEMDMARSLTVRAGGRTVTGKFSGGEFQPSPNINFLVTASGGLVAELPDDKLAKVTIQFTPRGGITLDKKPATLTLSNNPPVTLTLT